MATSPAVPAAELAQYQGKEDTGPGLYSCIACHDAKRKCDRRQPCGRCKRKGYDCVMQARLRGRPPISAKKAARGVEFGDDRPRTPSKPSCHKPAEPLRVPFPISSSSSSSPPSAAKRPRPMHASKTTASAAACSGASDQDEVSLAVRSCARTLLGLHQLRLMDPAKASAFSWMIEELFALAGRSGEWTGSAPAAKEGEERRQQQHWALTESEATSIGLITELMTERGLSSAHFILERPCPGDPPPDPQALVSCTEIMSDNFISTSEVLGLASARQLHACLPLTLARLLDAASVAGVYESIMLAMFCWGTTEGRAMAKVRNRVGVAYECVVTTRVHWEPPMGRCHVGVAFVLLDVSKWRSVRPVLAQQTATDYKEGEEEVQASQKLLALASLASGTDPGIGSDV